MCTVILAHRVFDDSPILFGANRDEQLTRPAEPPALRDDGPIAKMTPRDLEAGGTWLGVNAAGVLSAITNRFGKPADPERRSRGELVDHALAHDSAEAAARAIATLAAADYNPFHLIIADATGAHLVFSDGARMSRSTLQAGLTVLTERSLGAAENQRKQRVLAECRELLEAGDLDEPHLQQVLSKCDPGSMDATCVSLPGVDYGTRSSTIIRLGAGQSARHRLLHADGPPCSTEYEDQTGLLGALF
ncbi:MAG: NRDE family protein [Persicimonas sp.]